MSSTRLTKLLAMGKPAWEMLEKSANRIIALGTLVLATIGYFGLQDAHETFETGSRAWIAPIAVGLNSKPEKGKPVSFGVLYDNVGKIPATDINEYYQLHVINNSSFQTDNLADTLNKTDFCKGIEPKQGADILYPNAGKTQSLISIQPTDLKTGEPNPFYDNFISGNYTLIVQMCIAYKTLNKSHHSAFCYFYKPGLSDDNNFNHCNAGNKAD